MEPALVLTLLALIACQTDPVEQDALAYEAAMRPALQANRVLADHFLAEAARVGVGEVKEGELAASWEATVLPQADSLVRQARSVHPQTPELQALHQELVGAWEDRASAYQEISQAMAAGDPQAYQTALERNSQAREAEERYFSRASEFMDPYGLNWTPYPQ